MGKVITPAGEEEATGGTYPVLPLRDIVVFPHMIVPLFVGRQKSIAALEEVMNSDRQILLFTQRNAGDDDPETKALYPIGTLATVLQLLKLPDGTVKVLVEGNSRAKAKKFNDRKQYVEADAEIVADTDDDPVEIEALARSVVTEFEGYVKLNKKVSPEVVTAVTQIEEYSKLSDTVAQHLAIKIPEKQEILGIF
ncbi:MAG: LON peptidase substrate-binding domain-containing protein, partial [Nitratireductor sp.]|nr:LON peptidase substrate-binding domain-containing protein [Nitratireductor sp.]